MIEIAPCPVCGETNDCEHRLVEWYGWPGEWIRGSLCPLIKRMESSITGVMVLCAQAEEPTAGLDEETVFSETRSTCWTCSRR